MMADMGKFLTAPSVGVDVIVSRDIFAAHAVHEGKYSGEYSTVHARITLPAKVMKKARIKDGDAIELSVGKSAVVVTAREGEDEVAWMPNSPWVNALIETPAGGGLPPLKLLRAEIRATREDITPLDSLLKG